ncbi:MAG TPA: serine hydrolase [Caulobacteraceae bacterium]
MSRNRGKRRLERFCALAFVLAAASGTAAEAPADEALIGLWVVRTEFSTRLDGDLVVRRNGQGWFASLGGRQTRFQSPNDQIRFSFAGEGGFRGRLSESGRQLDGFWLQPAGGPPDRQDPGGAGQAFASPLTLKAAGQGTWRGEVRPLKNTFNLYVKIYRDPEGHLVGAIRNPEMNANGGATLYRVTRKGDAVHFGIRASETSPEIAVEGAVLHGPERLRIFLPDVERAFELTRREPAQAGAFFPRPPGEPAYAYRPPAALGDGWTTARAGEVGMDEAALSRLVQRLIDVDPAVRRAPLMHSLLVAHRGKLVLEEYFFGYGRDDPHDLRSAGKTFSSVMLGAAMMNGAPLSAQTSIYGVMSGLGPFANPDPRKARITLAHLMTHTSGLDCDDNDDKSLGREDAMQSQTRQPNWWKYTLDLPMKHDPGARYAYCSANTNLVGGALTTATGTWLPELFDRTVARPLEFGPYYWNLMPTGEGYQGGGAFLRPRDFLKVGQVYADGGIWRGRRIVGSDWVTLSTSPHVEISPETTGLGAEEFPNFYSKGFDGYAWHLNTIEVGGKSYRAYEASGNGGQVLIVVPQAELVVAYTAGNYGQGGIWGRWRDQIVGGEIIPAIAR